MRRILAGSLTWVLMTTLPAFAGQASAAKTTQAKAPASPVNLNTASQADLEALPGVGPATAKKIIAGRPYSTVSDLAKAGVPKSTIDKITSMVTVGSAPAAAPKSTAATPPPSAPSASTAPAKTTAAAAQQPPAKGMVWVNLDTKVFHREGDRYYGKTKNGKFMTEADAVQAGYREAKTAARKPKA